MVSIININAVMKPLLLLLLSFTETLNRLLYNSIEWKTISTTILGKLVIHVCNELKKKSYRFNVGTIMTRLASQTIAEATSPMFVKPVWCFHKETILRRKVREESC